MSGLQAFHEVRFPLGLALGAAGGPEWRTEIITLANGREARNSPWAQSRRRWDAGVGVKTLADLHTLVAFFEARRGRLHGFRWRDPVDHASCAPGQTPSPADQPLGVGDGATSSFSLIKRYVSGAHSVDRTITKPVAGTVLLAVDLTPQTEGVDFTVDATTGQVTFTSPPATQATITAGYEYDTPVRFDVAQLSINLDTFAAGAAPSAPVVEIMV